MNATEVLPFISSAIMLAFTISVLQRGFARRKPHFLFWGVGLAMFTLASLAEAYFALGRWSTPMFFAWYLCGAALNAAWIGHGTLLLLVPKRGVHIVTGGLIVASLAATALMVQAILRTDGSAYVAGVALSEQYRQLMPPIADGGLVRLFTPLLNSYGMLTLVGGALWSSWLFFRKQMLPKRVLGNVLIAVGALSVGLAGTLTRLGSGGYLYLGELLAAGLMYSGFLVAAGPAPRVDVEPARVTSAA